MGGEAEKQEKRRPWMRLEFSGGGGGLLVFGGVIVAAAFAVHRAHVSRKRNKQRFKDKEHEVADGNKKRSDGEISDGGDGLVEIKEYEPITVFEQQREVIEDEKREINETHAKKRDLFIMQDERHQEGEEEEKQIEGHDSNGDSEPFANDAYEKGDDCVEVEEENLKSCSIEGVINQLDKKVEVEETDINEDIEEETQTNRANGEEIVVYGDKAVQIDETMVVVEKNEGEEEVSNETVVAHFSDVEKKIDGSVDVEEEEVASCNIKEDTNHLDDKIEPEEADSHAVEVADTQPEQASTEDIDGFEEKVVQIDKTELLVVKNEMEEEDCDKIVVAHVNGLQEKDQKQETGYEANDSEEKVCDSIEVEEDDVNHTNAQIDEVSVSDELLVDHWNQVEQEGYDHHYGSAIVASLEESEEKHDDAEELHEEVASQSNEDLQVDSILSVDDKVSDDQFLQIVPEKERDEIAIPSNIVSGIQVVQTEEKDAGREAVEEEEEELQPNEVQYFNNDVLKEEAVADFEEVEKEYDHKESTVSLDEELDPSKDEEEELQPNEVQFFNNDVLKEDIVTDFEESKKEHDEELEPSRDDEGSDGSGTSSTENAEAVWPAEAIEDDEQFDGKVEAAQTAGEIVPIARTELRGKSEPQATTRMQKIMKKANHHRILVLLVLVLALVLGFLSLHHHELLLSMIYGQLFFPSNKNVP